MTPRPLAIASFGAFVAALSTSLVAVSIPVIARELAVTPGDASWVLSAYLLSVACLLALAGKAADVLGRKRVYLTGFLFFTVGSAMCASAPMLRALIGARVMQGTGAAMLMAVGPALVTRAVPPERRARGLGIQLAATYVGLTLGPSIGGVLAATIGWHAVFVVIAGAGAIGGVLAVALLPADAPAGKDAVSVGGKPDTERPGIASLDLGGAVLFGGGLAALLIALKHVQEEGWMSRSVLAIGAFSIIALATFARHEALHATPLLPLALFRKLPFSLGIAGAVLLYTLTFILSYLLPFQLQRDAGLGPAQAGAFMTAQPAAMAVVAPLSGALADRWGPRVPSAAGMVAIAIGLACVAHHGSTGAAPGALLVASLALVGAGAGLYVAPNSALIMGAAPRERQGTAGAMAATARSLGMTFGIAIAASLHHTIGFRASVLVAATLAALGALLAGMRPSAT
jgi:EmrB/QacA subfamily drug resistance transporter